MTRNDSRHKVVILVFLFITTVGVWAVDYDPSLDSPNPSEILERSYLTPSLDERAVLRGYLAREHPQTVEGTIGRAWLATRNREWRRGISLYRRAVERDPSAGLVPRR